MFFCVLFLILSVAFHFQIIIKCFIIYVDFFYALILVFFLVIIDFVDKYLYLVSEKVCVLTEHNN